MEATSVARPHGLRLPKPRRVLAALSDERLVEQLRRGDDAAFEVLYDRHNRGILAFCRHMLRSADEAEDAVQHSFIAAYNALHRDETRDIRFKAWLYTIARNRCLSVLRARREDATEHLEITIDRLSEDVQQRADLQLLLSDIGRLPDDQREALVLAEVGDLSHAEVAAVVGCEVAKVKSLVFQARSALIERRDGRDTPCEEIRAQIATLRGGALRRSSLRHHLDSCPGCSQYRDEVKRQRQLLAIALPVVPSLGLRSHVLAGAGIGGVGGAGGAGLAGGFGLAAKSGLAKAGIAALVIGGGAGTTVVATHGLPDIGGSGAPATVAPATARSAAASKASGPGGPAGTVPAGAKAHNVSGSAEPRHGRSQSGTAHGFTPVQGGSNGDAARQFAQTRGQGNHTGLTKTHATHPARAHVRKLRATHPAVKVRPAPRRVATPPTAHADPKPQPAPTNTTEPTQTTTTSPSPAPAPGPGVGKGIPQGTPGVKALGGK